MPKSERGEQSRAAGAARLKRVLGEAEHYADDAVERHDKDAPHYSKRKIEKIAKAEAKDVEGAPAKKRLDRAGRKKGGRAAKGAVNVIIMEGGSGAAPAGGAPAMMPARPVPPMPTPTVPQGTPGAANAPPGLSGVAGPQNGQGATPPLRKKGGRAVKMKYGAASGLGRLEKAAAYGAKP